MRRHDFQIASPRLTITSAQKVFPIRYRVSLERGRSCRWLLPCTEQKTASLRAGFGIDFEDVVVFPADSDSPRHSHNRWSAVGSALLARGFVLRRIPSIGDLPSFSGNGNRFVVALF